MKKHLILLLAAEVMLFLWGTAQTGTKSYYTLGKQAQASKNYLLAIENFKKATLEDPGFAEAWYELGRCNNQAKKVQAAKENFLQCIQASTTTSKRGGVVHDRNCACGGSEYVECDVCDVFGYEQLYYPDRIKVLCRTCGGTKSMDCPSGQYVSGQAGGLKKFGIESYKQLAKIYFGEEDFETAASYYRKFMDATAFSDVDSDTWYSLAFCENALTHYTEAETILNRVIFAGSKDGAIYLKSWDTRIERWDILKMQLPTTGKQQVLTVPSSLNRYRG